MATTVRRCPKCSRTMWLIRIFGWMPMEWACPKCSYRKKEA